MNTKRIRIGIVARPDNKERIAVAERIVKAVGDRADILLHEHAAEVLGGPGTALHALDVDVLVTVGGDGTILYAMQQCKAPILGVNLGELGFLTEIEPRDLEDGIEALLAGRYSVEERVKVATRLNDRVLPDAVNEAVIKTARASKMLHLAISLDGDELERLRCDGLILATPTGSTSYAMSAGGPIVDPRIDAMLVVPLAPFKLGSRPIVVPSSSRLEVTLATPEKDAVLAIDGQHEEPIGTGDVVRFTGSTGRAKFVRFREQFYRRLKEQFFS